MDVRRALEDEPDLPRSWDHLLQVQLRGQDPTAAWRDLLAASAQRSYGVVVAPTMPAAFILQWTLEVAAGSGVYAARQQRGVHDPAASGLTFAVHPTQGYPTSARFRHLEPTGAGTEDLLTANHRAYRRAAVAFAETYRPGVNLGLHQRLAMVSDVWAAAVARGEGGPPPDRGSCCYIYVLPGAHACAGCPRLRGPR